jgi:hypothetical protein
MDASLQPLTLATVFLRFRRPMRLILVLVDARSLAQLDTTGIAMHGRPTLSGTPNSTALDVVEQERAAGRKGEAACGEGKTQLESQLLRLSPVEEGVREAYHTLYSWVGLCPLPRDVAHAAAGTPASWPVVLRLAEMKIDQIVNDVKRGNSDSFCCWEHEEGPLRRLGDLASSAGDPYASAAGIRGLVSLLGDQGRNERVRSKSAGKLQLLLVDATRDSRRDVIALVAAGGIPALLAMAQDGDDANDERQTAAEVLYSLIKRGAHGKSRDQVIAAGGLEVLVSVAEGNERGVVEGMMMSGVVLPERSPVPTLAANERRRIAANSMAELVITGHGAAVVAAGGIPVMLPLIRGGADIGEVEHTCFGAGAFMMLSRTGSEECLAAIEEAGAIPLLVAVGREPCEHGRLNVAFILRNLVVTPENRRHVGRGTSIAAAGGIPLLLELAREEGNGDAQYALNCMAENEELRSTIIAAGCDPCSLDWGGGYDDEEEEEENDDKDDDDDKDNAAKVDSTSASADSGYSGQAQLI